MKKLATLFFAFAMILSIAFVSDSSAANAQNDVSSGGKYVYRKGADGTRYVYRKTSNGTVYVGKQTFRGGKWTFSKAKRGTKAIVSRAKKIFR